MTLQEYFEREGRGSRQRLATATGLRYATILDIANGKNVPRASTAKTIEAATAGAVSAAELLGVAVPVETAESSEEADPRDAA
jgi:hypothetical protein